MDYVLLSSGMLSYVSKFDMLNFDHLLFDIHRAIFFIASPIYRGRKMLNHGLTMDVNPRELVICNSYADFGSMTLASKAYKKERNYKYRQYHREVRNLEALVIT